MDSSLGIVLSPAELVASAGVLTSPAGILSLAAAALIVFAAVWTLRFRPRGFPPGPPPLPFLGNVYPGSRPRHDKIDAIREIYPKGGAVLSLSLNGVRAAVLVSDYRVFEEDIKGRAAKVLGNRPRIPLMEIGNFNKGISMSNGAHWLATRKFALGAMRENGMGKKSLVKVRSLPN